MQRRPFGVTGFDVPIVGYGTWNLERDRRAGAVAALRAALDAGATHVDTAELYGGGLVEELVAEALDGRRDEVFLVSKVLPSNATRRGVLRACEASLKRLKTDRLDCYLLHWPGPHPLEDTIGAFEELQRAGKIRSYGVSNFDLELLEEAVRMAGRGRIACNQVLYHLGERYAEAKLWPVCKRLGVALVGYSPFGSGDFPAASSAGGRVLAQVAEARGCTARQLALAFLARLDGAFTIPKTADAGRARENTAAGDIALTEDEVSRIDAAFPIIDRDELPTL
jgi:diketogulonate reductase-like aldo/keto reductase